MKNFPGEGLVCLTIRSSTRKPERNSNHAAFLTSNLSAVKDPAQDSYHYLEAKSHINSESQ